MGDQIIVVISAFGLIAIGLYLIFGKKGVQKPEYQMVEATIVDHVTETDSTNSGSTPGQNTTVSTFPVYEYTLNGKTYRTRGTVGITIFTKGKYVVGAREMVRIHPDRPNRIYTDGEKNATAVMGIMFVIFGLLTMLVAI